jgi:DNA-binding NarL/FixJ family response regulator
MRSPDNAFALVVEDNLETRQWLVKCVRTAFPELDVVEADTVAQAIQKTRLYVFSVALVDLGLPDGSGLDVIQALHSEQPDCYVVVATIYDDDRNLFTALKAGARGYILKDQDRERIVSYLQGIRKDQPPLSPASSQRLINHFNNKGDARREVKLTPREEEVLCLIAKGCSVDQSADLLNLSADTVKGYVKSVYAKLGVSNRSEVTLEAIRLGIIEAN